MLQEGMKVKVYFNLHKGCFSVQHKGRVVAHVEDITLTDVSFAVNENGRQRVLATKRKEVHAFVKGTITRDFLVEQDCFMEGMDVTYNPYKHPTFVVRHNAQPVSEAKAINMVCLHTGTRMWALV
jgi:hypothetical protein